MGKETLVDRLQKARAGRSKEVTVAGSTLNLHKWTLDQSLKHSALIWDILRVAVKDSRSDALKQLLEIGGEKLFSEYGSRLKEMLADTVSVGNFDSVEDASKWVAEITLEDSVQLMTEVWRMNLLPLARRLGVALPGEGSPAEALKA